ncbi:ANTAR domain-containing protein [Saccharothrix sp.]|uniref:ANTAR domain-containing protein n=1 Tax=Saccharothrix sp. TaxID=1873460 RepID=UPI0028109D16|nr:ANTAR domain-containing protein [Saccharothrix sp.]
MRGRDPGRGAVAVPGAGGLDAPTLTDALAFAELALRLLLDEQAGLDTTGVAEDTLPLHNPQVHQATGMVAAQLGVGMADAFAHLRARAFAEQRPLGDLAADVVARRRRFDRDGGRP